jgi:hypothetical protein
VDEDEAAASQFSNQRVVRLVLICMDLDINRNSA